MIPCRTYLLLLATVLGATPSAAGASWEMVMQSSEDTITWWVDETLGVRMSVSVQPQLGVVVRFDQKLTYFINREANVHAIRPWGEGGFDMSQYLTDEQRSSLERARTQLNERLQGAGPEAQKYAENLLGGKLGALTGNSTPTQVTFRSTGRQQTIRNYNTTEVLEYENGQPTGRQFWVTPVRNWSRIAQAMEKAMSQMKQVTDESVKYSQLGGIPVRIVDRDGASELVKFQSVRLGVAQMSPARGSQKLDFMQFMAKQALPGSSPVASANDLTPTNQGSRYTRATGETSFPTRGYTNGERAGGGYRSSTAQPVASGRVARRQIGPRTFLIPVPVHAFEGR